MQGYLNSMQILCKGSFFLWNMQDVTEKNALNLCVPFIFCTFARLKWHNHKLH